MRLPASVTRHREARRFAVRWFLVAGGLLLATAVAVAWPVDAAVDVAAGDSREDGSSVPAQPERQVPRDAHGQGGAWADAQGDGGDDRSAGYGGHRPSQGTIREGEHGGARGAEHGSGRGAEHAVARRAPLNRRGQVVTRPGSPGRSMPPPGGADTTPDVWSGDRDAADLPDTETTPEGFEALVGTDDVAGEDGRLVTYSLELEPAADVDLAAFVEAATKTLTDEERGWPAQDRYRLQRVEAADADVRVVLASPTTTDQLCARAGLDTRGRYSCWNGQFAALNAQRWRDGAAAFDDEPIETYRGYLVNHEVGHGLGYGHYGCSGPGHDAPVMMQQSMGTGGCEPNPWPYPQGPGGAP